MSRTFKAGDKIVLVNNEELSAKIGSTAIVLTPICDRDFDRYVRVEWIRDELSCNQKDGHYFPSHFELVVPVGKQLEFSFMEE